MKMLFVLVMVFSFITSFLLANSLELGSPIPQLKVLTDEGITLDLGEALSAGTTLVFFYPKAMTPGCVKQACSLRDGWDELQSRDLRIFGVSSDTVITQAQFRDKYTLPFTLLADTDGKIADAFSKSRWSRQAYLFIDGILVWRDLMAATSKQATDILAALDELEPNLEDSIFIKENNVLKSQQILVNVPLSELRSCGSKMIKWEFYKSL